MACVQNNSIRGTFEFVYSTCPIKAIKLLVFGPFVFFCGLGFNEGGIEAHTNEKNRWAIGVLHTTFTYVVGS